MIIGGRFAVQYAPSGWISDNKPVLAGNSAFYLVYIIDFQNHVFIDLCADFSVECAEYLGTQSGRRDEVQTDFVRFALDELILLDAGQSIQQVDEIRGVNALAAAGLDDVVASTKPHFHHREWRPASAATLLQPARVTDVISDEGHGPIG